MFHNVNLVQILFSANFCTTDLSKTMYSQFSILSFRFNSHKSKSVRLIRNCLQKLYYSSQIKIKKTLQLLCIDRGLLTDKDPCMNITKFQCEIQKV